MVSINDSDVIDVLWGAEAIGAAIGANRRRAFHMLESGQLPAKRIGGRWCARRSELLAALLLITHGAARPITQTP